MFFNMFFCIFLILLSFCNTPKTIFYMIYKTYKIYKIYKKKRPNRALFQFSIRENESEADFLAVANVDAVARSLAVDLASHDVEGGVLAGGACGVDAR